MGGPAACGRLLISRMVLSRTPSRLSTISSTSSETAASCGDSGHTGLQGGGRLVWRACARAFLSGPTTIMRRSARLARRLLPLSLVLKYGASLPVHVQARARASPTGCLSGTADKQARTSDQHARHLSDCCHDDGRRQTDGLITGLRSSLAGLIAHIPPTECGVPIHRQGDGWFSIVDRKRLSAASLMQITSV